MDDPTDSLNNDAFPASNLCDFEPGQIVGGKYKIVSILGRGGMGTVYRVEQVFLNKEFALKTIERRQISDLAVRRFQQEAKAASLLDHPNLVQVHDFGLLDNGQPFLVMDLIEGVSLSEHLRQYGPLPVDQAARLFAQACFGLLYAHEQGVIHRDIKPSNLMLVNDVPLGEEGSVRVVDFGIAKITNSEDGEIQALTRTGEIFGSPLYMSPEQCSGGKIDQRSDIYSLGCVLFEALTGAPPHLGNNALATMILHQSEQALPLREASLGRHFPEHLELIVAKMLQKPPGQRYQNLGIVAHQLAGVSNENLPAEIRTSRSIKKKLPRVISLTAKQLCSLLLASSLSGATLSAGAIFCIEKNREKAATTTISPDRERNFLPAGKERTEIDSGILDGFADLKMEKYTSARSIRRVMEADSSGNKSLVFPECGVGDLWAAQKGALLSLALGQAKGRVLLPGDIPLTLVMNNNALQNPDLLKTVAPGALFGIAFKNSDDWKPEPSANEGLKKIIKLASGWSALQSIALSKCRADAEVLNAINNLQHLRYLDIRAMQYMDQASLAGQPLLGRLNGLYICGSTVDQILPKLAGSSNLRYLFLGDTYVSADLLADLRRCRQIEYLAVMNTKEKRIDNRIIQSVAQLKSLNTIAFYCLSPEQLRRLETCSWLTEICLYKNAYTPAQRALIKSQDARIKFTD